MSEVLNFYLQKYGLIEKETENIKIDANEKAKERWNLLRRSICSVSDIIEKQDLNDIKLSHGIEFVKRINHINPIEQAVFIPSIDSYLTLDGCAVRLFDSNGRCKDFMAYGGIPVKFRRLQYANCSDRYIAWTPDETELAMLNSSFDIVELIDQALIEGPIKELLYNEDRNEIISSHRNRLLIWQFRYANKHLIPRLSINISHEEQFATIFSIERTQRENQRLFLANDTGVTVVELSTGSVTGSYLSLHDRPISALTFFNPLKLLSTGCRDGSIKVWSFADSKIHLKMVFVGHTSLVSCLAFFPGGSQATIASCGGDKTLRVWSLELNDEVECLDLEYCSQYIGSDITRTSFFTLSTNFIDIWHQNHLSDDLLSLTAPVSKMVNIDANKCLVQCRNNLLFYLESSSSRIITKTVITKFDSLNTQNPKVLSTIHLENQSLLLVLIQDNEILHYTTKSNPMVLVTRFQYESDDSLVLLTVYKPLSITTDKSPNKNLIFSGSKLGWIRVHDLADFNKITFEIDAHTESEVVCMISDPLNSRLYTSGMDNTIKLWYVYPFAVEPLSKILSFFCGLLPTNLININNYLFTVFHDRDRAHYPCVVYNIESRARYDHSPSDDHIEPVSSISACERMKLFLSCSAGTENLIKIWTHKNVLLRQIEMHFPVYYAIFSSLQGDILTGIGYQISYINHSKYLPKLFVKKQILMYFEDMEALPNVTPLEVNEEIIQSKFSSEDRDKLNGIKSVFKYESYVDILTEKEELELNTTKKFKKNNLDRLHRLEDDIRKIQQGNHDKPKRKYEHFIEAPSKSDIFNHYFSQIVKYSKITLPGEVEDTKFKSNLQPLVPDKYKKSDKEGFFPSRETISKIMAPENLRKGGYIPNSAVLQSLWPPKVLSEKADIWRPTMLSDLDIKQLELLKTTVIENEEEETKYFDWDSDKDSERTVASPEQIEVLSEDLSEDLMSKYGSIFEEKQSIKEEINEEELDTKPVENESPIEIKKRPVTTKVSKESLKLPIIARKPATMPEIKRVRFISSADDIAEEVKSPKVSMEIPKDNSNESSFFMTQIPTESDKKSVLPRFISRFETDAWFNRICPPPHNDEKCLMSLPTPLNANSFTMHLLHSLKDVKNSEELVELVNAIGYLYSNETIEKRNIPEINKAMEKAILELASLEKEAQLSLLKSCLHLMASLEGISDRSLVTICLSRFFDADPELKGFLKSILYHLGLEDNTDSVERELMNFKLFSVRPGQERMEDLYKIVSDWLDKWFQSMTQFAAECREIIGKEMHLIGTRHGILSNSTVTCLESVKNVFHCHILSPADLVLLYPHEKNPKSILNYINCLNYFRFKKLLKEHSIISDRKTETEVGPKKTIVSLPKLNPEKQFLVRFGESHALGMEEKTKKDFLTLNTMSYRSNISDFTQHPSMQPFHHYQVALGGGFVPFMHLRLKPCLVNPFPRDEDFIEWEKANPKSLFGSYNKAFIPQFSLPPEPF